MRSALQKFFQPLRVNDYRAGFFAVHPKEWNRTPCCSVTVVAGPPLKREMRFPRREYCVAIHNDLDTRGHQELYGGVASVIPGSPARTERTIDRTLFDLLRTPVVPVRTRGLSHRLAKSLISPTLSNTPDRDAAQ